MGSLLGGLLFSKNGLGTCDITAGGAQRVGVTHLLRSQLHALAEMGLLQCLDFGFDASNVFLAQFSSFGHFHGLLNYAPR